MRRPLMAVALVALAGVASAQTPVTRGDAILAAQTRGARLAVARADTAAAAAAIITARALPNPSFSASYSKDVPKYHYIADIPLDLPMQRSARIASARAGQRAARYRFAFERAGAALDADTTYTRALAARDKARISRRTAQDADSLRRLVVARREAGDASELDVRLATITAGQASNTAASDSLAHVSAVLDLQIVMGLVTNRVAVSLADSLSLADLAPMDSAALPLEATTLQIAAAEADVEGARLKAKLERRSIFTLPSFMAGIETGDPDVPGVLPTFGITIPVPILNRNRGPIKQAEAEQARALATLALTQTRNSNDIARARRELAIATERVARSATLVRDANQVVAMSFTAYREGASPLANVLEAQRDARAVLAQYIDDLAEALIFAAELRVITLTPADAQ